MRGSLPPPASSLAAPSLFRDIMTVTMTCSHRCHRDRRCIFGMESVVIVVFVSLWLVSKHDEVLRQRTELSWRCATGRPAMDVHCKIAKWIRRMHYSIHSDSKAAVRSCHSVLCSRRHLRRAMAIAIYPRPALGPRLLLPSSSSVSFDVVLPKNSSCALR